MPIRAVTFDFWRTLFRHVHSEQRRRHRVEAIAKAADAAIPAVEEAMAFAETEFGRVHQSEHRTLGPEDAVRIVAERLNRALSPECEAELIEVFARGILDPPPPIIEGAAEAVRAAAERFPVGLISDTGFSPGRCLREVLANHGLLDVFGVLVFSDEMGVSKPQRRMFDSAAVALDVRVEDLLHIGDLQKTDIAGAKRLGARAALFVGDNSRDLENHSADYVLHSWNEFLDMLPRLAGETPTKPL